MMMMNDDEEIEKYYQRRVSDPELALCSSSSLWNDPILEETCCKGFF